jgi:hypothetical protein
LANSRYRPIAAARPRTNWEEIGALGKYEDVPFSGLKNHLHRSDHNFVILNYIKINELMFFSSSELARVFGRCSAIANDIVALVEVMLCCDRPKAVIQNVCTANAIRCKKRHKVLYVIAVVRDDGELPKIKE